MDKSEALPKPRKRRKSAGKLILPIVLIVVAVVGCIALFLFFRSARENQKQPEVITVATLEKIINVSELSTFTAVYNGIAKVNNEQNPEKVDYYVSYEARVKAGFDLDKIKITVDNEAKTINIKIPGIYITDSTVDIGSLDFIFINDKELTHFSYTRYIENQIRETFGFRGTPLHFIYRERKDKG